MTWWGTPFDKAYGFSNIASNALKKAQKKIDKVLDIPTEDELSGIKSGYIKPENKIEIQQDHEKKEIFITEEFSDISLKSPEIQLCQQNELVCESYYEPGLESKRLGDWNTDESLTASQFAKCYDTPSSRNLSPDHDYPIDFTEPSSENQETSKLSRTSLSGQNTPVQLVDFATLPNDGVVDSTRNLHMSVSSDCTTSTVKRVESDLESIDHNDELMIANNKKVNSDPDFLSEENTRHDPVVSEVGCKVDFVKSISSVTLKLDVNHERQPEESPQKLPISHSISVNSACKDEIDSNTTSSDIELLSGATSTNGDNHVPVSHPVSRFFVPDYMKHQRSTSGSSMSICKIDNCDESTETNQFLEYQKQLEEIAKKLDIRETKMIQLSRENIDLRDTINCLTRQIEQMNERQETDTTDINVLTREFTTRLSDAEKRYQFAHRERDQLKKYVTELKNTESQQIERVIREKEEQVASLLQEGEKLAQDQLKANNTIKKLRLSLKENESEISLQNQKLVKIESELSHMKKIIEFHEENERKHIDGINQLTKAVEKLEKENSQLNNAKETTQDRNRSLESALDRSGNELIKLRKQIIDLDTARLSMESNHKSLIDQQVNKSDEFMELKTKLAHSEKEIGLLQQKIQSQARENHYKEDEYNSRISYLQDRVAEMEQRQEELSEGASVATKPILRQLEALQNTCSIHTSNWERNEMNLNMKLTDLQQKLAISEEAAQTFRDQLQNRDFLVNSLREEKHRLLTQYNQEYTSRQTVLDEKMIIEQKLTELQRTFDHSSEEFARQMQCLELSLCDTERKLDIEKQNSSNISAKLTNVQLMLNSKPVEMKTYRSRSNSGTSCVADTEPDDSVSTVSARSGQTNNEKRSSISGTVSIYEQLRQQGVAVMIEYLEASLKQKEGQINKLHQERDNMSRSRESMIEEMTALTRTIERLESQLESQRTAIENVTGLTDRYNALLQMYGEKFEQCEELQMDLSEMKEVYRAHIDMLSKTTGAAVL